MLTEEEKKKVDESILKEICSAFAIPPEQLNQGKGNRAAVDQALSVTITGAGCGTGQ